MLAGCLKPGMINRSVSGYKIETDLNATPVSLLEETLEIRICAVTGGYPIIIGYIIACVLKRGDKTGIQPDCIYAQRFKVIQFLDNARDISNAVSV
jgi:hypothetical protein